MTPAMSPFWNPKTEQLPKEQLQALQVTRLRNQVAHAMEHIPFHRRLYQEAKGGPEYF